MKFPEVKNILGSVRVCPFNSCAHSIYLPFSILCIRQTCRAQANKPTHTHTQDSLNPHTHTRTFAHSHAHKHTQTSEQPYTLHSHTQLISLSISRYNSGSCAHAHLQTNALFLHFTTFCDILNFCFLVSTFLSLYPSFLLSSFFNLFLFSPSL